ncbi:hypothetical protein DFJ58DRAFT_731237 [Suillus subalutaceus]|uniref:uncharacterized protein n=1 Tax=Suillus subalutaceus TaxID=48586 RepID=UPI001B86C2FE|nr:uncharacterized protein DFJ58DRAFT_731237 [Suillus subalutaceus]KAG1844320.1 hypothetical protein DFJ58DRAFT_731237 [Suillus subalutaceus]
MSSEQERQTIVIPMNLGSPSQYDPSIFPLMKMKRIDNLDQVAIVIEATLDELFKIRDMAGNLTELESIFADTKEEVTLREKRAGNPKDILPSCEIVLEISFPSTARSSSSHKFSSSEKLRRWLLSVEEDVQPVEYDDVPSDARISAIAVPLESPLDEATVTFFTEAADSV